jgi:hypothetical protein
MDVAKLEYLTGNAGHYSPSLRCKVPCPNRGWLLH